MKKNIWILNHHAGNMFFDKSRRHYMFGKYMREQGYRPIVLCSNARHDRQGLYFGNEKLFIIRKTDIKVPFIFVKGREYVGNGKDRVLCMLDYLRNVQRIALAIEKKFGRPDIIYASSVHPLALVAGIKLARRYKIKCICEVRDLWPETLVELGFLKRSSPITKALYNGEKWIYRNADIIIFTMEGGYDYITEKRWDRAIPKSKCAYVNNGVDLDSFKRDAEENIYLDEDLENNDNFKVIYTGTIRQANGLDQIIDCAEKLRNENRIRFLIFGSGDYLEHIEEEVKKRNLNNIRLKGRVDHKFVPYILSKGDLNLLNYDVSTSGIFKYGSSQNKLFEYLASGTPVISNRKIKYSIIDKYQCGVTKDINTGDEYAGEIKRVMELPEAEYRRLCDNALKAAEEFDYKKLTEKIIDLVESA